MKIYQLDSATRDADTNETIVKDPEAYDLTMWLESGVFEAVELKWVLLSCVLRGLIMGFGFSLPD